MDTNSRCDEVLQEINKWVDSKRSGISREIENDLSRMTVSERLLYLEGYQHGAKDMWCSLKNN